MITKELYVNSINAVQKYYELIDKVSDATNGAIELFEMDEVQEVVASLQRVLEYCTDDIVNEDDPYGMSNLDYFMYEQEFGKRADELFITEEDGTEHKTHNAEEFWDYMVSIDPDIEDREEMDSEEDDGIDHEMLYEALIESLIEQLKTVEDK